MSDGYYLQEGLDPCLVKYASKSWNAYQAVHAFQQYMALAAAFADDLRVTYGPTPPTDDKRVWGVAADLLSAMVNVAPTYASLIECGFTEVKKSGDIIGHGGDFMLANSPVLSDDAIPFKNTHELGKVLKYCNIHDRIASRLLETFREEVRSYDLEINELRSTRGEQGSELSTFFRIFRQMPSVPDGFPMWDGRPMFLDEQRAFLDYIAKFIGAEVIASSLVDARLGMALLVSAKMVKRELRFNKVVKSAATGSPGLDRRPMIEVCHVIGDAALGALAPFSAELPVLELCFVVEEALKKRFNLDLSGAFEQTRSEEVASEMLNYFGEEFGDESRDGKTATAVDYEFPRLKSPDN